MNLNALLHQDALDYIYQVIPSYEIHPFKEAGSWKREHLKDRVIRIGDDIAYNQDFSFFDSHNITKPQKNQIEQKFLIHPDWPQPIWIFFEDALKKKAQIMTNLSFWVLESTPTKT